jgi:hypothetical protein
MVFHIPRRSFSRRWVHTWRYQVCKTKYCNNGLTLNLTETLTMFYSTPLLVHFLNLTLSLVHSC